MKKLFWWKQTSEDEEMYGLEDLLGELMIPVMPRPEYVKDLGRRLVNYSEPASSPSVNGSQVPQNAILILAGILSGAVVLAVGVKATLTFLAALGVARQMKRSFNGKPVSSTPQTAI